jgi:hypothetical protein
VDIESEHGLKAEVCVLVEKVVVAAAAALMCFFVVHAPLTRPLAHRHVHGTASKPPECKQVLAARCRQKVR